MNERDRHHVTFVLATHNRRDVVCDTVARLHALELDRREYRIIVVDNASTDGTGGAVGPQVDRLISLRKNTGSCAKAAALPHTTGRFTVLLDDDSHPRRGSVTTMIETFERDPLLGAVGFTIHLPDGRVEGGALPHVFVGCGVGFRTRALRAVGGLDPSLFMQAEEYDLSFRLAGAGWRLEVFDDLHVEHLKTDQARATERTTFYDVRNNFRVAARHLPDEFCRAYRDDWTERYRWLAMSHGHERAFRRGLRAGRWAARWERWRFRRRRPSRQVLERFFGWRLLERKMAALASDGVRRVVLAGLGKNVYAYYRAALRAGVEVVSIGDDRFAAPGRAYRGIPVRSMADALSTTFDAAVVADSSPVHGRATQRLAAAGTTKTVHRLFPPGRSGDETENDLAPWAGTVDQWQSGTSPDADRSRSGNVVCVERRRS